MYEKLKRPKTMSSRDMLGDGLKFAGKELLRGELPELGEEVGGLLGAGFVDGLGECMECINYEPKIKREKKKYPKINKQVFNDKFNDHRARAKEKIEREREKRRKQKASKLFF